MRPRWRVGCVLLVVWLFTGTARADGFDGQRLAPPMGAAGGLAVERPWILRHLGLSGGLVLHYARDPVVEREQPSGRDLDHPLRDALTLDLLFSIGLGNFVELAVHLPIDVYYAGDPTVIAGRTIVAGAGVGDLRLAPKFLFWRGGNRDRHGSVGIITPVSFPTGDGNALRGSGWFVLDPRLLFGVGGFRWELFGTFGYRWRFNDAPSNLYGPGELTYGVGALVRLPVWKDRIELSGELSGGYNHEGTGSALVRSPLEALVGAAVRPHRLLTLYGGLGAGLTSGLGTPDVRAIVGVRIASRLQSRDDFADDDRDGIPNGSDNCPKQAEDRDGFEDADGCPDWDNDRDGIDDENDECPDQPEERGGDGDGCPDKTYVVVRRGRLFIFGKIQFDTGSTRISARSRPLLDQIAAALRSHPTLRRVRIIGHTDNVGGPGINLKLSRERSESVRAALVARGVESGRLRSEGYGEERPVASNGSAGGRAKNRRVEFVEESR